MALSRQMRRSGVSSPKPPPSERNRLTRKDDNTRMQAGMDLDQWEEPPLRNPAPSFEDYKGLERHGVLEHMAPLGSLPSSKVKARTKQHEPAKRGAYLKNGDVKAAREDVSTPEPAPPVPTRCSVPRNDEGPQATALNTRGSVAEPGIVNGVAPTISPTQASPVRPTSNQSSTVSMSNDEGRWKKVVDAASQRANEKGNHILGAAIQKLYEESLHDEALADLLDAILSQRQTEQQAADFQIFIKAESKRLKKSERASKQATSSVSQSPAKTLRVSATRQLETSKESSDSMSLSQLPSPSTHLPSRPLPNRMTVNGSPFKDTRPSKRIKPSRSISTDSSLSSLNSDIEDFAPEKLESNLSKTANNHLSGHLSKAHPDVGPRLGSFSASRPTPEQDSPEARIAARRRLKEGFASYFVNDSSIRSPVSLPTQPVPTPTALQQRAQQPRRNGLVHESRSVEDDIPDSPASSQGELPVHASLATPRGITPQLGRPPKVAKKATRIKQSPLKKRNGVTAGVAQHSEPGPAYGGGGRNDGNLHEAESCATCSGGGRVLLCDKCKGGFHLTCCDPPIAPWTVDADLPPQWYCPRCHGQLFLKDEPEPTGLFGELKKGMRFRNPTAFKLPRDIRDHFEGVATGEEGEYEEAHNAGISKTRPGYDEIPDNFKVKDRKDNTILCFTCGGSALGKRELVACDYCALNWHLDCLDPPLASAPNKKSTNGKPRQTWMCPNHVDHTLANLHATPPTQGRGSTRKAASDQLQNRRVFRTRKPKQANIVEIALKRGFRNNGLIEVEEEESEEESEIDREMSGVIYKVPEHGIKLDFIDRIKQSNLEAQSSEATSAPRLQGRRKPRHIQTSKSDVTEAQKQQAELNKRPFKERQAALNLAQMAQQDAKLNADTVSNLIDTLTAEAPEAVQTLLTAAEKGNAKDAPERAAGNYKGKGKEKEKEKNTRAISSPVSEQEKKDLEALIALAQRRLSGA